MPEVTLMSKTTSNKAGEIPMTIRTKTTAEKPMSIQTQTSASTCTSNTKYNKTALPSKTSNTGLKNVLKKTTTLSSITVSTKDATIPNEIIYGKPVYQRDLDRHLIKRPLYQFDEDDYPFCIKNCANLHIETTNNDQIPLQPSEIYFKAAKSTTKKQTGPISENKG